ncbi:MAG TPA: vitamin K epoxide reductase family protein [Candidatus Eisenbacteria bacterium]|nr:vitamin K epoxide reductase family protein [Candidatus Eisenbacteria bacterium]
MTWQKLAVVASVAGLAISIYLTVVHYSTIPLACPANAVVNCEQVLSSRYAVIGDSGLPTSAAGIAWFLVSAALALLRRRRALLAWSSIGLLTVLVLVYIEIVKLGAVCIWCTAAHAMVLLIFLIALPRLHADTVST